MFFVPLECDEYPDRRDSVSFFLAFSPLSSTPRLFKVGDLVTLLGHETTFIIVAFSVDDSDSSEEIHLVDNNLKSYRFPLTRFLSDKITPVFDTSQDSTQQHKALRDWWRSLQPVEKNGGSSSADSTLHSKHGKVPHKNLSQECTQGVSEASNH